MHCPEQVTTSGTGLLLARDTGTGVWGRDIGIGCRRNANATVNVQIITKLERISNERIRKARKVGEISKIVQERKLKWYGRDELMQREDH